MRRIISLMMLCMIAVSCSDSVIEEPNPPIVVPEVPKYTVTVNCSDPNITVNQTGKLTVIKGATVKIVAIPKPGYDAMVSIDGNSFSTLKDTVKLVNISTNYLLEFKSQEIPVVVITPTRTDTLCAGAWKLSKSRSQKSDGSGLWNVWILDQDQLTSNLFFYLNGRYEYFHANGTIFGNGNWNLSSNGKILTRGGIEHVIFKLTNTEMVLVSQMPYYYDVPDANGKYILKGYTDLEDTYSR